MWTVVGRPRPLLPPHGLNYIQGNARRVQGLVTEEALYIMGNSCSVSGAEPEEVIEACSRRGSSRRLGIVLPTIV